MPTTDHETLDHLDLFSGIGGFALAARWNGLRTVGFSETARYASRVLEKNFPGVPNFGDITRSAGWPDLRPLFLVTGGFPCQPFSVAGKRLGAGDDRALWPAMLGVIGRYRPAWVLGENVSGIINMELDRVLSDLEAIGYAVRPFTVPACALDAPHRRDRVWIVANAGGGRRDGPGGREVQQPPRTETVAAGEAVAHAEGFDRGLFLQAGNQDQGVEPARGGEVLADTTPGGIRRGRAPGRGGHALQPSRWLPEPGVGRVAYGVSGRVDRLKGLGNAIVPQVAAEFIRLMLKTRSL